MPVLPFPDPPLIGELVRLRPWREADLPAAHEATRDPLVPRFTRVPEGQSAADLRAYYDAQTHLRAAGAALQLAVADPGTDAFLGAISLLRLDWDNARGELGYWLAPQARGRGVATQAVRLLSRWAVTELGLGRLALHTDPDNAASQRVAERSGFTREGTLRAFDQRKGRRFNAVVFSVLPEDLHEHGVR